LTEAFLHTLSAITPVWELAIDTHCHNSIGLPPTDQPDYPMMNLAAFWQQMLPIMPVLLVFPTHKYCPVNNLAFEPYHGMEEVTGSIPIRSTNIHFKISQFVSDTLTGYWEDLVPIGANFAFLRRCRGS
jgi:hypothetical protein